MSLLNAIDSDEEKGQQKLSGITLKHHISFEAIAIGFSSNGKGVH